MVDFNIILCKFIISLLSTKENVDIKIFFCQEVVLIFMRLVCLYLLIIEIRLLFQHLIRRKK